MNTTKSMTVFFVSLTLLNPAYSQGFSNSSLDKKLGSDKVVGSFIDNTGATGGSLESASSKFIAAVVAIAVLVGFILVAKSLYDMYLASKDGRGYMGSVVTLIVGSALAILPVITFFTSNTVQDLF